MPPSFCVVNFCAGLSVPTPEGGEAGPARCLSLSASNLDAGAAIVVPEKPLESLLYTNRFSGFTESVTCRQPILFDFSATSNRCVRDFNFQTMRVWTVGSGSRLGMPTLLGDSDPS